MTIDAETYRAALGHFSSGVTIITSEADGYVRAMTASAFTSVSLRPAQVLVCVGEEARINATVRSSGRYGVSILCSGQETLSNHFGRPLSEADADFAFERWRDLPVVPDALVHLAARVVNTFRQGDHFIYVGEVTDCRIGSGEPLIYYRGGYERRAGQLPSRAIRKEVDGSSP